MGLVVGGLSNPEIGARLYLSEAAVKTHVGRILMKLAVRDRIQPVILAYERGLVPRDKPLTRGRHIRHSSWPQQRALALRGFQQVGDNERRRELPTDSKDP